MQSICLVAGNELNHDNVAWIRNWNYIDTSHVELGELLTLEFITADEVVWCKYSCHSDRQIGQFLSKNILQRSEVIHIQISRPKFIVFYSLFYDFLCSSAWLLPIQEPEAIDSDSRCDLESSNCLLISVYQLYINQCILGE